MRPSNRGTWSKSETRWRVLRKLYIKISRFCGYFSSTKVSFKRKQHSLVIPSFEMSSSFGDLLQQAEQLTADMDSGWELPRVERNLHQLAEAGQRLWTQTTGAAGDNAEVKA